MDLLHILQPYEVRVLECLLLYLKTEIKTPELLDNPERWVSMVVAVDPVIEQITGTYRDNVQCLSECRLVVHHKKTILLQHMHIAFVHALSQLVLYGVCWK